MHFLTAIILLFSWSDSFSSEIPIYEEPRVKDAIIELEHFLRTQKVEKGIPGLAGALVYDQKIIWSNGFGQADIATNIPVTPKTIFRVGSITKLFTATMLMQIRDQGELQLDDSIEPLIPITIKNPFLDPRPITFKQIVSHTSGLQTEAGDYWKSMKFPSIEKIYAQNPIVSLEYAPLSRTKYSNFAISMLGDILSKAISTPYSSYISQKILTPLGMKSSYLLDDNVPTSKLANGYTKTQKGLEPISIFSVEGMAPAAALYSTVEDMAKFMSLQFRDGAAEGSQVLGGYSIREMHQPVYLFEDLANASHIGLGIGLGWFIREINGNKAIGHGGGLPGYTSDITLIPSLKIGLATFTNIGTDPTLINKLALEKFVKTFSEVALERVLRPAKFQDSWKKYLGTYDLSGIFDVCVRKTDKFMIFVHPSDKTGKEGIFIPVEGDHTFKIKGGAGNGEIVSFDVDPNGNVNALNLVGFSEDAPFLAEIRMKILRQNEITLLS